MVRYRAIYTGMDIAQVQCARCSPTSSSSSTIARAKYWELFGKLEDRVVVAASETASRVNFCSKFRWVQRWFCLLFCVESCRALSALAVSLLCLFLGGLCQLLLSVCPVCSLAGFVSSCCQSALSVSWRALSALAVSLPCLFLGGLCQLLLSVCPVCFLAGFVSSCCQSALSVFLAGFVSSCCQSALSVKLRMCCHF